MGAGYGQYEQFTSVFVSFTNVFVLALFNPVVARPG